MSIEQALRTRGEDKCELCGASDSLAAYDVPPDNDGSADKAVLACASCIEQIEDPAKTDPNHWRCLNDSMWSTVPAVQVVAWRMLTRLRAEGWPADLLDMLYLEDDVLAWAKAAGEGEDEGETVIHKDANGALLAAGDSVTLIKDLKVKGAGFTAKQGTPVRNISLVPDNSEHIEGKVSGQTIVILTKFVKKSG